MPGAWLQDQSGALIGITGAVRQMDEVTETVTFTGLRTDSWSRGEKSRPINLVSLPDKALETALQSLADSLAVRI
jgi:hypothetical protein